MTADKIQRWKTFVAQDPDNPLHNFALAGAYLQAGEFENGATAYARCLELDPQWMVAAIKRARCLVELKHWAEAQQALDLGARLAQEQDHEEPFEEIRELRDQIPQLMSSAAQDPGEPMEPMEPMDEAGFAEDVREHLKPYLGPLLEQLLPDGGAPEAEELAAGMARFCAALATANQTINLTGIKDAEGMAIRHCLDSLVALPHLLPHAGEAASPPPLVDIGSGCGVPGIPLAIARPDLPVVLVESRQRKSEAIAGLVETLQLGPRVQLVHARAEVWLKEHDVGTLVTRAVGPVNTQLELFGPLRTRYRRLVMLKGPAAQEELEQAAKARHKHRFPEPTVHETELPGGAGKRVVLVFEGGRS